MRTLLKSGTSAFQPGDYVSVFSPRKRKRPIRLAAITSLLAVCTFSADLYASYSRNDVLVSNHKLTGKDVYKGRGSWFGQYGYGRHKTKHHRYIWRDREDHGRSASGAKQTEPGIALPSRETLGHWFDVQLNGKVYRVRQTDIGPARWTGRKIDINAALADRAGYSPWNFPTNAVISYRYVGNKFVAFEKKVPKKLDEAKVTTVALKADEGVVLAQNLKNIRPQIIGGFPYGLHPVIKTSMVEASKMLPPGYKIRFNNAARRSSTVGSASYHVKRTVYQGKTYALAVDIHIVDNRGQRLKNIRSPKHFKVYREFMENTKKVQYEKFPAFRGKGRWGGYFVFGVAQDLMHYDLGPENGTIAGNWFSGLKARFAKFGLKGDVGEGMGDFHDFPYHNYNPKLIKRIMTATNN